MRAKVVAILLTVVLLCVTGSAMLHARDCGGRPCPPDRPVPPESVGTIPMPFDIPVWPTLLKTEFNILPWISFGKASICLPRAAKAIEVPVPYLSLKPIPIWIPWLRPLDIEVTPPGGRVCP